MTVYGLDYRPGPYQPTTRLQRLWPLAWMEFRALFRHKWGILLFLFCIGPAIVRLVFLLVWLGVLSFDGRARHVAHDVPNEFQGFIPTNVGFYVEPVVAMEQGAFFFFLLLSAMTSARAIARDRGTNALELFWTRGISPTGYFLGKWFGSFLLLGCMTIAAPVALWAIGTVLAEDWSFLTDTVAFMPRVVLGLTVFTVVLSGLSVLVSASSSSANVAMILWCGLLAGSLALSGAMWGITHDDQCRQYSVFECASTLARACTGTLPSYASVGGALAELGGLGAVLLVIVRRRLRTTEAIA